MSARADDPASPLRGLRAARADDPDGVQPDAASRRAREWLAACPAPLPQALLPRLAAAHPGVVTPVGVGLNVAGLRAWAEAKGWQVLDVPPRKDQTYWLWCPQRRADLSRLHAAHVDALVLADADLLLSADDWRQALPGQTPAQCASTYRATGGWPAALPLARACPGDAELHLQPALLAQLGPLMPPEPLLAAASTLAVATRITNPVAEALGVPPAQLHALHDGGWLCHGPAGWAFPPTLRRWWSRFADLAQVRLAARALADDGWTEAALGTLAEGRAWDDYLDLLARTARAGMGEAALREALGPLPAPLRDTPAALYVGGLLARAAGDLPAAIGLYGQALSRGLPAGVEPMARNARGVVHAMGGDTQAALADFDAAALSGGITGGEAGRNRAALLVQLGRHDEAEHCLLGAVAAFRQAGDTMREARSLETLGGLQFARGLLRESLQPYRRALELLLPTHPSDAAMVQINLAECHLVLGETDTALSLEREARSLAAIAPALQVSGWLCRLEALLQLQDAQPAQALATLEQMTGDDRVLQAEHALLQARALRELGQPVAAAQALAQAGPAGLRAQLEAALQGEGSIDAVIEAARAEQARHELAWALLKRGGPQDLAEALALIRQHGYRALLDDPVAAPLVALAQDDATRALFPMRLQLIGPLRVAFAGHVRQLGDFPARKSAALFVALALARQPLPREQLAERFWPDAKNPLASLQTAIYHLRTLFGAPVVNGERGVMSLQFPVRTDVGALQQALASADRASPGALLRRMPQPARFLPDLANELHEERSVAERILLDAHRAHVNAQPAGDVRRRDALRALLDTDPHDTDSREALIRWHEARGELELAQQERERLQATHQTLGLP